MEFKGTKGKWKANHKTIEFCDTGDYEYHAVIEDENGKCIAQCFAKDEDLREADCNVMAAALEMLDTCIETKDFIRKALLGESNLLDVSKLNNRLDEVISKALGKEVQDEKD